MIAKSLLASTVLILQVLSARGEAPFEVLFAEDFLQHLSIGKGSTNSVASSWTFPSQFTLGTDVFNVSQTQSGGLFLSTNGVPVGMVFDECFSSELEARMSWALQQTSKSSPPQNYFDSYLPEELGTNLVFVYQGPARILDSKNNAMRLFALWDNHVFKYEAEPKVCKDVFVRFLRAGGVEIPDEEEDSPAP